MHGPIKLASSARQKNWQVIMQESIGTFKWAASFEGGDGARDHLQQNGISDQIWTDVFIHVERL